MKRSFRLSRSTDFERVRRLGKSYAHPLVVLISLPNHTDRSRFGVAAGRTVGIATERNRAKRLIRAALRALLPDIVSGWDVVVLARRPMVKATYEQTRGVIHHLLTRADLLREYPSEAIKPSE